jgi:hypothetical protein
MSHHSDESTTPQEEPHIRQARELLQQKRPQEAIQVIRRHLSFAPATSVDYLLLGVALAESGEGLQATGILEQAEQMNPREATIPYKLGLLYRQAGRAQEAVAAFERALAVRPDYEAARQALEHLRQQAQVVTQAMPAAPSGPVKCPHCGMESRAGVDCEWCAHPLHEPVRPPVPDPAVPGPAAAPIDPDAVPVPMNEYEELAHGSLIQRVLKSAWKLIIDPYTALNGGLDNFFNSPGAVGAVIGCYILSLLPAVIIFLAQPRAASLGDQAPRAPMAILMVGTSIAVVIISSAVIAFYNLVTGGSDGFLSDFGSLALSFAFISATIQLVMLPLTLPLQFTGQSGALSPGGLVLTAQGLWELVLEIMLVVAATDLSGIPAFVLLMFANAVGYFGVFSAAAALSAASK